MMLFPKLSLLQVGSRSASVPWRIAEQTISVVKGKRNLSSTSSSVSRRIEAQSGLCLLAPNSHPEMEQKYRQRHPLWEQQHQLSHSKRQLAHLASSLRMVRLVSSQD